MCTYRPWCSWSCTWGCLVEKTTLFPYSTQKFFLSSLIFLSSAVKAINPISQELWFSADQPHPSSSSVVAFLTKPIRSDRPETFHQLCQDQKLYTFIPLSHKLLFFPCLSYSTMLVFVPTSLSGSSAEQSHKPKPNCIPLVSCKASSLCAFQGYPLLLVIKSCAKQWGAYLS